ncbi:MAG: hypothetical protein WDN44_12930 [Sphingomonas sp.]
MIAAIPGFGKPRALVRKAVDSAKLRHNGYTHRRIHASGTQITPILNRCDSGPAFPRQFSINSFRASPQPWDKAKEWGLDFQSASVIEPHGGNLTAANRSKGGAAVCLTLPAAREGAIE